MAAGIVGDIIELPADLEEQVCGLLARRPNYIDGFIEFATSHMDLNPNPSVAECTALLAGLDARAVDLAAKLGKLPQEDRQAIAQSSQARMLLHCELLADCVRERRRHAVGRELARVPCDAPWDNGEAERFVDEVVWPLLCRAWVPLICWEPALGHPPNTELWTAPGTPKDHLLRQLTASESRGLPTLLSYLGADSLAGQYLETAWLVRENYRSVRDRKPVAVRVLFGPVSERGWIVGHLLRALVVPIRGERGQFAQQSLTPALQAVEKLLGSSPLRKLPPGCSWDAAVGDYPGGAEPPPDGFVGPSGSLPLGVALVAAAAGLEHRTAFHETGHLLAEGDTRPLADGRSSPAGEDLRAKRMCAALAGTIEGRDRVHILVGSSTDEGALLEGAPPKRGCAVTAGSVRSLIEAVGTATDLFDIAEGGGRKPSRPLDEAASGVVSQVAQSIARERDVKRWAFVMPPGEGRVEMAPEPRLAEALTAALRRELNASGALSILPILLDPLHVAIKSGPTAELVVNLAHIRLPDSGHHRSTFLGCLRASLKDGCIVVVLRHDDPAVIVQALKKLDTAVQRVVIIASPREVEESTLKEALRQYKFREALPKRLGEPG